MTRALLAVSLLLVGCGETNPRGGEAGVDASTMDAARPDAQADVEGTGEWVLLIRYVHLPDLPPSGSHEVPGMDLDGHVTASGSDPIGCFFEDWVAPARYVDTSGVDNQVPDIISAIRGINDGLDLNRDVEQAIHDLDALLVIRITRIGDPLDDGEVDVALFQVDLVGEPVYEMVTVDGETLELLAPNQTFRVQADSLIDGRPRTQMMNASLRGGRLYTPGTSFSLRIPARDMRTIELELDGMQVGGRVSETTLESGLVAGYVRVEDVPATIASLNLPTPPDMATVDSIASSLADIDVDGDGPCEAISIGLQVEGVAASLVFP
ncbi:MAG: hypothetical protein H6719_12075 [Sandaracinaceae bacterium]|nr:hypothetical protein [Sandaracinaceae bacterium]